MVFNWSAARFVFKWIYAQSQNIKSLNTEYTRIPQIENPLPNMCDFGGKNLLRSVYFVKGLQLCMYKATHCFFKKIFISWILFLIHGLFIIGHPPPGPIRALAAGGIILDNYIMRSLVQKHGKYQLKMHPEHKRLEIYQRFKGKHCNFLKQKNWLWKSSNLCSNCEPFAWKMHLHDSSKSCMGSQTCK